MSRMDPEEFRAWQRVIRDFAIVAIGSFMLVHETVWNRTPNIYIIGAGLTALGLPPAIRFDEKRRSRGGENGDDEKWSHLP